MEVILSLPIYLLWWCLPFKLVCCMEWVCTKLSDICFFNYYFQDPTNLDKFNVSNFFHVKNNIKVIDPGKDELKVGWENTNPNMQIWKTLWNWHRSFLDGHPSVASGNFESFLETWIACWNCPLYIKCVKNFEAKTWLFEKSLTVSIECCANTESIQYPLRVGRWERSEKRRKNNFPKGPLALYQNQDKETYIFHTCLLVSLSRVSTMYYPSFCLDNNGHLPS